MSRFLLPILIASFAFLSSTASAQDASFYDCQNDRMQIAVKAMPLDEALATFTRLTRCPVSIDTDHVKGRPTRSMKTASIKGRRTPGQALARMLRSTPLKSKPIHGGFSVSR